MSLSEVESACASLSRSGSSPHVDKTSDVASRRFAETDLFAGHFSVTPVGKPGSDVENECGGNSRRLAADEPEGVGRQMAAPMSSGDSSTSGSEPIDLSTTDWNDVPEMRDYNFLYRRHHQITPAVLPSMAVASSARPAGSRSQYHSIQQLSQTGSTGSDVGGEEMAIGGPKSSRSLGGGVDAQMSTARQDGASSNGGPLVGLQYGTTGIDTLDVLRGILSRYDTNFVSNGNGLQNDERRTGTGTSNNVTADDDDDEEEEEEDEDVDVSPETASFMSADRGVASAAASTISRQYLNYGRQDVEEDQSRGSSSPAGSSSSAARRTDGSTSPGTGDGRRRSATPVRREHDEVEAKKARVENIVNSMRTPAAATVTPSVGDRDVGGDVEEEVSRGSEVGACSEAISMRRPQLLDHSMMKQRNAVAATAAGDETRRRSKRKQYVPQQHDVGSARADDDDDDDDNNDDDGRLPSEDVDEVLPTAKKPCVAAAGADKGALREQLCVLQEQLETMYQTYLRSLDLDLDATASCQKRVETTTSASTLGGASTGRPTLFRPMALDDSCPSASTGTERLAMLLKAEISQSVEKLVDNVVRSYVAKHFASRRAAVAGGDGESRPVRQPSVPNVDVVDVKPTISAAAAAADVVTPPKHQHAMSFPVSGEPRHASMMTASTPIVPPPPPPPLLAPPTQPLPFPFSIDGGGGSSDALRRARLATERFAFHNPYLLNVGSVYDTALQQHRAQQQQQHLAGPVAPLEHLFSSSGPFYQSPSTNLPPRTVQHHKPHHKDVEQLQSLHSVATLPKKKRTKVTDTRLSPRVARALLHDGLRHHSHHQQQLDQGAKQRHYLHTFNQLSSATESTRQHDTSLIYRHQQMQQQSQQQQQPGPHLFQPHAQASSVIHQAFQLSRRPPPDAAMSSDAALMRAVYAAAAQQQGSGTSLQQRVRASSDDASPEVSDGAGASPNSMQIHSESDGYDSMLPAYDATVKTSTLTPMHLRKAKLMFFYVRYPSSAILKVYFPDVKFNKNNTAQLVKWFSNFREFFYIQMEKYARQALAEGVKNVADIVVSKDDELYRVLVLHYNRNNQIEVPENFRFVVQSTLREFFLSIAAEKDLEQSWKKAIYKVIARMDDTIPEYFKSVNWMQQLLDS